MQDRQQGASAERTSALLTVFKMLDKVIKQHIEQRTSLRAQG